MKTTLFMLAAVFVSAQLFGQMAVTVPTLELQEALNHAEQMNQAVQSYQTMVSVRQSIDKGVDAIEKVNEQLRTVREVQDIATRSTLCIRRIRKVYELISNMEVDPRYTVNLLTLCNQTTKECVAVTAYGANVFKSGFLKMSDAERLAETRRVLDDIDRLNARTNSILYQARAIQFNNLLMKSYIK